MTLRAQVELASGTGLPEDTVVNTFHFGATGPLADDNAELEVVDALIDFYTVAATGSTGSVGNYLSPSLSRNVDQARVIIFDLEDPEPRQEKRNIPFTLPASGSSTGLPDEVAVAVSWKASVTSGELARRRRGRNFIGPLNATTAVTTLGLTRPDSDFLADLARSAGALINYPWVIVPPTPLVIFSAKDRVSPDPVTGKIYPPKVPPQAADAAYTVIEGYVDNAFDTIRSRGHAPTSRILFT